MSERDRLRAKAPDLAAFVDALRAEGIDARVKGITFADGEAVGRRWPASTWPQEWRAAQAAPLVVRRRGRHG